MPSTLIDSFNKVSVGKSDLNDSSVKRNFPVNLIDKNLSFWNELKRISANWGVFRMMIFEMLSLVWRNAFKKNKPSVLFLLFLFYKVLTRSSMYFKFGQSSNSNSSNVTSPKLLCGIDSICKLDNTNRLKFFSSGKRFRLIE